MEDDDSPPSWFCDQLLYLLQHQQDLQASLGEQNNIFGTTKDPVHIKLDLAGRIGFNTAYIVTALASFGLNVVTIIVLSRNNKSPIRNYLINLCISDLLISLFAMPVLSMTVSVFTMTVIGIFRHTAIVDPIKDHCERPTRDWWVIPLIWIIGIIEGLPMFNSGLRRTDLTKPETSYVCQVLWPKEFMHIYVLIIFLTNCVIPLLVLIYLWRKMTHILKRNRAPRNQMEQTNHCKKTKAIKLLSVVLLAFIVAEMPLQVSQLVASQCQRIELSPTSPSYTNYVIYWLLIHWLSMAHSCINPLIYCFMCKSICMDIRSLILGNQTVNTGQILPFHRGQLASKLALEQSNQANQRRPDGQSIRSMVHHQHHRHQHLVTMDSGTPTCGTEPLIGAAL